MSRSLLATRRELSPSCRQAAPCPEVLDSMLCCKFASLLRHLSRKGPTFVPQAHLENTTPIAGTCSRIGASWDPLVAWCSRNDAHLKLRSFRLSEQRVLRKKYSHVKSTCDGGALRRGGSIHQYCQILSGTHLYGTQA